MRKLFTPNWLHYLIAAIWIANGLVCKVLNLVPRHQEIVTNILGSEHPRLLTVSIGVAEIAMAGWILSGIHKRLNVIVQIVLIATMNTIEIFLVPELLLWGKTNALFAFLLIVLIYYNEVHLTKKITHHAACCHF
jgi:DoxX-like family